MHKIARSVATLLLSISVFISLPSCASAQKDIPQQERNIEDTTSNATIDKQSTRLIVWIGKQPVNEKGSFLKLSEVEPTFKKLVSGEVYERLTNLKDEPYYLTLPVERFDGYYFLHFPPNNRFNRKGDRVMIAFLPESDEMHVATINDQEVQWKHSKDVPSPSFMRDRVREYLL